jgi:MOSC domain-containing protein YiiM
VARHDAAPRRVRRELPLSVAGLVEEDVCIGDVVELGGALVQVSQPRGPCFKLAARWGRKDLPARMARGGASGWYYRVLSEGKVSAGDELRLTDRTSDVTVAEVMRVTYRDRRDSEAIERALAVRELAAQWRRGLLTLARRSLLPEEDFGVEPWRQ